MRTQLEIVDHKQFIINNRLAESYRTEKELFLKMEEYANSDQPKWHPYMVELAQEIAELKIKYLIPIE